jgi:hypothetical protein
VVPSASNPLQDTGSSAAPAYAAAPRRTGLLIALAGVVVVAAIAAVAIFMTGARAPGTGSAGAPAGAPAENALKELDARKATLEEAARGVLQPAAPPPAAEGASSSGAAPPSPAADEAKPAAEPAAVTPPAGSAAPAPEGKGEAPAARTPSAPPAKARAPAARAPPPPAKPAPQAPSPQPKARSAAPAAGPPAAPAASPGAEHWTRMNEELSRCSNDSVIPRIQCERRIRARYCEGYWGTVPECPGGRTGPVN